MGTTDCRSVKLPLAIVARAALPRQARARPHFAVHSELRTLRVPKTQTPLGCTMLESLNVAPPDPILGLNEAFRNDTNPEKINLSVGVYKDANGATPILESVKTAEQRLLETETNKSYLPIDGNAQYDQLARELLLGDTLDDGCGVTLQTPGGTGALRVAAEFARKTLGAKTIWCSKPTWANHANIFNAAGLEVAHYAYLDDAGRGLDFESLLADLNQAAAGDVVCLHGCCHNPSGVDPNTEQWKQIAQTLRERQLLPLVDCAYQGIGNGIQEDAAGVRLLASELDEMLVCSSFSKNFGLYGERIGALTITASTPDAATASLSHAKACIRANYSNPPMHGAAIVATVLGDPALRAQWEVEVAAMRERIRGMRELFAESMAATGTSQDFSFITQQNGMFSFSGLSRLQVDQLRNEHSIYIVGSGRINVAGITSSNIQRLCDCISKVL